MQALLEDLGEPDTTYKGLVHFVTLSRVLPETLASTDLRDVTSMSRLEIREMVRKAFDDPLQVPGRAGRPCSRQYGIVQKLIVFREAHEDGTVHFHAAVLLFNQGPLRVPSTLCVTRTKSLLTSLPRTQSYGAQYIMGTFAL